MSDERFGVAATLFLALVCLVLIAVLLGQREDWRSDAISHGYAEYCPLDGAWAWKGECEP